MVSMRRHLWAPILFSTLVAGCGPAPQQMAESILRARRSWDTSKSHSVQCGAGERDWDYVCYDHIVSLVPGPPPRNVKLGVNITLSSRFWSIYSLGADYWRERELPNEGPTPSSAELTLSGRLHRRGRERETPRGHVHECG